MSGFIKNLIEKNICSSGLNYGILVFSEPGHLLAEV